MKRATKPTKAPREKAYQMPIAQDRFAHMLAALLGHIRGLNRDRSRRLPGFTAYRIERAERGEILDESTAREIADALHKLRLIYREEALLAMRPNRHESEGDLQDAANAQALIDLYGIDAATAAEALAGNPRRVERDSLARTHRNRIGKAQELGLAPEWGKVEAAAKKSKKAKKPEK